MSFLNENAMKKIFLPFFCFAVLAVNSASLSATDAPVVGGTAADAPVVGGGFVPAMPPAVGGFTGHGPAAGGHWPAVGGFAGPGPAITSARQASLMFDDAPVALRGHIVQHLGGEKYLFRDASGTIRVDIDHDRWPPHPITPNNLVELRGEIDRDWHGVEVDVDWIIVLQ